PQRRRALLPAALRAALPGVRRVPRLPGLRLDLRRLGTSAQRARLDRARDRVLAGPAVPVAGLARALVDPASTWRPTGLPAHDRAVRGDPLRPGHRGQPSKITGPASACRFDAQSIRENGLTTSV